LIVLAVAGGLLLFLWWFLRTPPEKVARALRRSVVLLISGVVIFLAATGRLSWIFGLLGALLPFLRRLLGLLAVIPLPVLQRLFANLGVTRSTAGPPPGRKSRISTRYLNMELDHDSGRMDGEVLEGDLKGRRLSTLDLSDLKRLLNQCKGDAQSAAVLQAYLDRMHPDWGDEADHQNASGEQTSTSGSMTEAEALEILGLKAGATREEIVAAHRRLIQKLHPDHGGSDYLAAQINRAKDRLLGGH